MKVENLFRSGLTLVAVALFTTFSMTSCSNDDSSSTTDVQEEEAVDAIENSLKTDTNGMAKSMTTAVEYAEDENLYTSAPNLNCGQLYTDSYTENYSSTNYTYNYSASCNYQLSCTTEGAVQSFSYEANRAGDYDTPRMSSDDEAVSNWAITGLEASNTTAFFNGTYTRTGTQVSKVRNQNTFSSTLTYSLSNIAVNKTTHQIASGSASVTFTGVSSTGNQYTYNGTITFNGDNTATLVINGNTYTINL